MTEPAENGLLTEEDHKALRRCPECGHDWPGHCDDDLISEFIRCSGQRGLGYISGCRCTLNRAAIVQRIVTRRVAAALRSEAKEIFDTCHHRSAIRVCTACYDANRMLRARAEIVEAECPTPPDERRSDYVLDGSPESVAIVREARGLPPIPPAEGQVSHA